MVGPRIYSSGDVLYGGQKAAIFAEVNSLEDAKHQVKRMKAYGARMIKVYQQPRRSQRIYFAEACRDDHAADGRGRRRAADGHDHGARRLHGLGTRCPSGWEATSSTSSRSPRPSTRRPCSSPTAVPGARSTTGRRTTPTTTRSSTASCPTTSSTRRPGGCRGSGPRSTTSRPSPRAPPRCCAPGATSRSARTARSRASALTGRSGRWPVRAIRRRTPR